MRATPIVSAGPGHSNPHLLPSSSLSSTSSSSTKRPAPADDETGLEIILNPAANYPRKRVAVACEVCRSRKTRCDSGRPCSFCAEAGIECVYRQSGDRFVTATDILSRIEDRLARLEDCLSPSTPTASTRSTTSTVSTSAPKSKVKDRRRLATTYHETSFRQTTAEAVTSRPSLLSFQSPSFLDSESWDDTRSYYDRQLRFQSDLAAQLDHARKCPGTADLVALLGHQTVANLHRRFFDRVIRWFPVIEMDVLVQQTERARVTGWSALEPATCLVMFALAVGSVFDEGGPGSGPGPSLTAPPPSPTDPLSKPPALASRGLRYYLHACAALLELQNQKSNVFVMQCRLLQTIYHTATFRTLSAWDLASDLGRDMMHLLSSTILQSFDGERRECFHRTFWVTTILLHELESALKMHPSGLQSYHDLVPLPYSPVEEESFYYFFAQVSMRKILTDALEIVGYRVGHVIYAPIVTDELASQSEKWYAALPPAIKFPLDFIDPSSDIGRLGRAGSNTISMWTRNRSSSGPDLRKAYLRYQFFAMRIVMFWPAVLKFLETKSEQEQESTSSPGSTIDPNDENDQPEEPKPRPTEADIQNTIRESKLCVDACTQICMSSTDILAVTHIGLHLSIWITYAAMTTLIVLYRLPALSFIPATTNPVPVRIAFKALARYESEPLLDSAIPRSRRLIDRVSLPL